MTWDREQVTLELCTARDAFCSRKTTRRQYDALQKVLGLALFNAPDDMRYIVEAHIQEAMRRREYFEAAVWPEETL